MTADDPGARVGPFGLPSPAAHRISDAIRQAIVDGYPGTWMAFRLSDGGSDGVHYGTRPDAVRHQLHEQQCAYVLVPRDDMSPGAAQRFLEVNRQLRAAGFRLADPESQVALSAKREEYRI